MASTKKRGLGKGLDALLGDAAATLNAATAAPESQALPDGTRLLSLDPRELRPNPKQPRRIFDEEALAELAESIRRDGVQEPVIVRESEEGYELVSGERRVRASVLAEAERIPAVCRHVSDRDMLKLGLIENIQREDLNAIELAQGYHQLIGEFEWTQEQLAAEVGKKRVTVTNTLRLLNLPDVVQEQVADGSLSMGHARAVLALESPMAQIKAARKIAREGLSVRQAEKLAAPKTPRTRKAAAKDPNIAHIEDDLRRRLGTRVHVKTQSADRGRIEIEYYGSGEFERIIEVLRSGR